jgi:hypothetical protein
VQGLAEDLSDRQPVGFKPQISVIAAEKRFSWFVSILRSPEGGPLGDSIVKKEYQYRGAVHWHMLFWVDPWTALHVVKAWIQCKTLYSKYQMSSASTRAL